jgi:hypothetical protein
VVFAQKTQKNREIPINAKKRVAFWILGLWVAKASTFSIMQQSELKVTQIRR